MQILIIDDISCSFVHLLLMNDPLKRVIVLLILILKQL